MARVNELKYTSVEICAGAGGQAVGLHNAGFRHAALIEIDRDACQTLRDNTSRNPEWDGCTVIEADLRLFDTASLGLVPGELDLLAGGVPCPPFSAAGKQLGRDDERDLFPRMLDLVDELSPKAVMIENVRGLLDPKFADYRQEIIKRLESLGYEECYWEVLEAKRYGVPQLRPRAVLVAMQPQYARYFQHTKPEERAELTVGEALHDSMRARYDAVADDPRAENAFKKWYEKALEGVAPTVVGGSKKHGGADLGPTRAKRAWADLGVCGLGVANEPDEMKDAERDLFAPAGPKLTVTQAALIQGFPEDWQFSGRKTAAYRQVGNAFPPPVAQAVGEQVYAAFEAFEAAREL
ncbi:MULTISPECIES: DNA (cytosine-5-)-methyltransferase [Streptomyces]|uniref:Cytosine-specific methyltransferase n=1 Tax=Streptomyces venezuelae TaxID=54571 RepID=A0A5P2BBZ2_STRVZ|nr:MULTISPECIES: DNA (cytosine-5-)-methyltransferase [Streptomyces]NEA05488.1 DNA (cytosine-5-)-methyltransferase [Streptomyces sp. SID10116]MYY81105.1 DNA (cytosine-5-)-methyltransferase [Streptomyces sp. SID335]MYZ12859.1 DNA (cytosine-5-)-methyltransferase [Streptomyces sp. SID337]NDZ92433.1 DNA (cytosine-5-)-methyltransferase [Streptomyces sp. SID10115]NEB48379.1 DNA (cytosine-5-)-methyltransferase [Streptomyces sp. SID339]